MLFISGFIGFLVWVAVTNLLQHRIVNYHFAKDGTVYGQIIPNRIAMAFTIIPLVLISVIIVGLSLGCGEYHALLIFAIGGGAMVAIMLAEQFTYLQIDGQYIWIHKLWKKKRYCTAEISSVAWKSCRGIIGKQLLIVFDDGKS